jgi:hypothetical protein
MRSNKHRSVRISIYFYGQLTSRIIKLLALTGQRRDEVGGMCWSEIDENKNIACFAAAASLSITGRGESHCLKRGRVDDHTRTILLPCARLTKVDPDRSRRWLWRPISGPTSYPMCRPWRKRQASQRFLSTLNILMRIAFLAPSTQLDAGALRVKLAAKIGQTAGPFCFSITVKHQLQPSGPQACF